ncbi:hypothetical protein FRB99_000724 [Tulasnella sp. 403]|nr:hypothetical protein FRB99_000724 [Tulasnella sp. 403]
MSYNPVANPGAEATPRAASFDDEQLQPPAPFRDSANLRDSGSYRDSYGVPSNMSYDSAQPLHPAASYQYRDDPHSSAMFSEKDGATYPPSPSGGRYGGKKSRPWWIIPVIIAVIVAIIVAVVVPVYFKVIKPDNNATEASSTTDNPGKPDDGGSQPGSGTTNPDTNTPQLAITGGDGSTVKTEDGSTFTYSNQFGGFWVDDPNDPFNSNAQAQSWSPPLNQSWDWQNNKIRGVNLGGWLVPEPFIVPALFEPYLNSSILARDEWTLSQNMAADTANGGLNQLENHYKTFITEQDFARIAGAGLNWVRLPMPFWAIQKYDSEPFLEHVSWTYALKAFKWARKYGIRINLDLHAVPGSQNGYNHSGKMGMINFLMGVMGYANAERGLDYMRIIVEFISQPEYKNLIPLFGVMNEARTADIGMDVIGSFYLHMHDVLRNVTGIGAGNGPFLSIHDGFQPLAQWADFLPGNDRLALDTHPYMCFSDADSTPLAQKVQRPCTSWAAEYNTSWSSFGVTTAGEWSLAINDCGLWVNGVNAGTRWEGTLSGYSGPTGGDPSGCQDWNNWQTWTPDIKTNLKGVALSSMDALQNWFFWTWKIGNSSISGTVEAPFWSYSLGLENGWMPTDPREAIGACGGGSPASALKPSMTGGAGSGNFAADVRAANPWPPTSLQPGGLQPNQLPSYTQTGTIPTLPAPTFTNAKGQNVNSGGSWTDQSDTTPIFTPISSCTYPDAWNANGIAVPPPCPAAGAAVRFARDRVPMPKRTASP